MKYVPAGQLRVITGPMFAGKTGELLRRIQKAQEQGREILVVNHLLDNRYGQCIVASHSGLCTPAQTVGEASEIHRFIRASTQMVAIDEAQFFGPPLIPVIRGILERGVEVNVAGLCLSFGTDPYEPIASLMLEAEEVAKLTAVCEVCSQPAAFHQLRNPHQPPLRKVGGAELYEARCRAHLGT